MSPNSKLVILAFAALFAVAAADAFIDPDYVDGECGRGSYCKFWLHPAHCQGTDLPCGHKKDTCTEPGSYCKYWLSPAVCQKTNKPCQVYDEYVSDSNSERVHPATEEEHAQLAEFNDDGCGKGSYCKFWQTPSVCFGSNAPCHHKRDTCKAGSYCKYWLNPAVCQGTNEPCTAHPEYTETDGAATTDALDSAINFLVNIRGKK